MRKENVMKVRNELLRCKAAVDEAIHSESFQENDGDDFYGFEAASLRRASMDLARALTRLRNER